MIRLWLKRADDGEAERYQDWLLSRDECDAPEPWSMPFAFLVHNGWDDNGCGDWPLSYQFAGSGIYPNSVEWHINIEPSNWTCGLSFFRDVEDYRVKGHSDINIKQMTFHFGPMSVSRMKFSAEPTLVALSDANNC